MLPLRARARGLRRAASSTRRASTSASSSSTTARPTTPRPWHRGLAAPDPRVEYRRNHENLGLIGTANAGLAWADDKDYIGPHLRRRPPRPGRPAARHRDHGGRARRSAWSTATRPTGTSGPTARSSRGRWKATQAGSGATGCGCAAARVATASRSPEVVVRTSVRAPSAVRPALHALQRPRHVAAHRGRRPTSPACAGSAQAIYRSTPRACCAAPTRPSSTCSSAARPSTPSSPRAPRSSRTPARCAPWPAAPWPDRPCGAPSRASTAASRSGPDAPARRRAHRLRARCLPRRAAAARWRGLRVRRRIGAGRSMLFLPFVATARRPPGARPRQPAALARSRDGLRSRVAARACCIAEGPRG